MSGILVGWYSISKKPVHAMLWMAGRLWTAAEGILISVSVVGGGMWLHLASDLEVKEHGVHSLLEVGTITRGWLGLWIIHLDVEHNESVVNIQGKQTGLMLCRHSKRDTRFS